MENEHRGHVRAEAHASPLQPSQRMALGSLSGRPVARRLDFGNAPQTPQASGGATPRRPSPHSRVVQRTAGDRFIPDRTSAENWETRFSMTPSKHESEKDVNNDNAKLYCQILRNELLTSSVKSSPLAASASRTAPQAPVYTFSGSVTPKRKSPHRRRHVEASYSHSRSPLSKASQDLLLSPRKSHRCIPEAPHKVLDAPELQDDFYLNLLDWSKTNLLSVALGPSIYLWNGLTGQVSKLLELARHRADNLVTAVSFNEEGDTLAVGNSSGAIELWDVNQTKLLRKISKHSSRVPSLAWNKSVLASGSRDGTLTVNDIRQPGCCTTRYYNGHNQEVCGLKWSPDGNYLASGGNDNTCNIWTLHSEKPTFTYKSHVAAVKAVAWSPYQHGVIATGGGTADQCIRFWNALTGAELSCVKTGSQVCNILFSTTSNELVSSHGYSQNFIRVWTFPHMQELARLSGHTYRVLYMALSPDAESIVTGAGDETLRFWKVFEPRKTIKAAPSVVNNWSPIR
eukprot:scpid56579/ scgid25272/ Fizzy-related protein homolog; Cdh1/Hct1 homolog